MDGVVNLFCAHRNAVRKWVKRGLPTSDNRGPMLILGADLRAFLAARRMKNEQTCQPRESYCLRCRVPPPPADNMADYEAGTGTLGNLAAICSKCETMIYWLVSMVKLEQVRGTLDIALPKALHT